MNPTGKVILNYGAMSGLAGLASFLIFFALGWNPFGELSFLTSWIPVVFICLSTGHYRDKLSGGFISYGQAFRIGFLTACAGAFLFSALVYLFCSFVDNNLLDIYKSDTLRDLEATKSIFGESIYELSLESIEKTTIYNLVSSNFLQKVLGGGLVSLITAGFYRKSAFLGQSILPKEEENE